METSNNQSFLSEFSEPNFCIYKCSKFAVLASGNDKLGKPYIYRATYCNASPGKSNLIWKLQICTTESRNTEIHQERPIKNLCAVTDLTRRRVEVRMAILICGNYIHTGAGCFRLIPALLWDDNRFWVKLNWAQIKLGMMNMTPIHPLFDSSSLWHVALQLNVNATSTLLTGSTEHNSYQSLMVIMGGKLEAEKWSFTIQKQVSILFWTVGKE